ncbi:MAG: beta-galactosidase [Chloroflexi bacterium]|nr:beta-galactosidase [Chloroflexota bacterium]
MPRAEVRMHNGSPALYLHDRPVFAAVYWVPTPTEDGWDFAESAHMMAEAGVHIYTFGIAWRRPARASAATYDFPDLAPMFLRVLDADPDARFLPRIQLEAPDWWIEENPGELETFADGTTDMQSYASQKWRDDASAYLSSLVTRTEALPIADRFVGYHVCAGWTSEWLKNGARDNRASDYSAAMADRFRVWLRIKYGNRLDSLRTAWCDPSVAFDTAAVPGPELQERADFFMFRDPGKTRQDIDYFMSVSDLVADTIDHFCAVAKQASANQALAGVFYGYTMELWWSNGWFGRHPNHTHNSYHRIGHTALHRVLRCPRVDFLASPYSYGFRGPGGTNGLMIPLESARIHGKLYFSEDDTRTHIARTHGLARFGSPGSPLSHGEEVSEIAGHSLVGATPIAVLGEPAAYRLPQPMRDRDYGALNSLEQTVSVLKRNFANVLTRAAGIWWGYPGPAGRHPGDDSPPGTLTDRSLMKLIGQMVRLGRFGMGENRSPSSQIAVIVDEESFLYTDMRNNLVVPLIQRQYLWHLPRIGAPYDLYLASDLTAGLVGEYRCYVFLNLFHTGRDAREAIRRRLTNGAVAVWIYAPGFVGEELSTENIRDLTGFELECHHTEWGLNLVITNFDHPITRDLSPATFLGTDSRIGPVFTCSDPDVTPLAAIVFTRGRWRTGMAVKEFNGQRGVWIGAPSVPSPVLRSIARYAGVHVYSDADEVMHAGAGFIGMTCLKPGPKTFRLPTASNVYEAFAGHLVARNVREFTDEFAPGETRLYYVGERALPSNRA